MTQPLTVPDRPTFEESMAFAHAFAEANHIEWYEVRTVCIDAYVSELPYELEEIGSSDGNHMIHSTVLSGDWNRLFSPYVARGELIARVVAGSGTTRAEALALMRALFAPAD